MAKASQKTRIKREKERLLKIYECLEPNVYKTCYSIICTLAFISVSLEDLQDEIIKTGWVETYQNGENQYGQKKSAAGDAHISLTKNQLSITNKLLEYTPPEKREETRLAALMRE